MSATFTGTSRMRTAIAFVLFLVAALVLVSGPVVEVRDVLLNGLGNIMLLDYLRWELVIELLAWAVCVLSILVLRRVVNAGGNNPLFVFYSYGLYLLLGYLAVVRVVWHVSTWMKFHWMATLLPGPSPALIVLPSAMVVLMGAAALLPRWRSVKEGMERARKEHDRFVAAAESSLDDFYIFDGVTDATGRTVNFRFAYLNPNAEKRLGMTRQSLVGKMLTEVRPFMVATGLIESYREVVRTGVPYTDDVYIDDGLIKATWINIQVVKLGDGIAITSRDVTEGKKLTEHVSYLAYYDQLTGLANRTLLQDRLRQAILRAQRHKQRVAVFMLDIDFFKNINDTLGHSGGDELLKAVGQRLQASVRETDTVARMGGDEFVIVMPEFNGLEEVRNCGVQIVKSMEKPFDIGERQVTISISVGLCIYPDSGLETEDLLKKADSAMYSVKSSGRNGLHIFAEGIEENWVELLKPDGE